jgi:molybdopterin synthase catalytic subunit
VEATAAAVAAAAAAVVTGTAGAATGGTNSIARALDSIVASASAAGALGGLHSPSGSNTPLSAANLGVLGANFGALAASANVNVNGGDKSKKSDDEHALASMLGGLSQVLGTTASEADQEAILNMARSGIGTGGALTPAQAAAAAMQAAAVNTMQARQQAQQQQAAKAVKAAAAASERAVAARFAAKDAALNPPPIHNDIGDIIEATVEPLDLARYLDAVRDGDLSADTGSELATIVSSIKSEVNDGKQPLGESLAQHGALVEGALLRISSMIRKRWAGVRRMALVLRLGEAAHGDVSLIIACSAGKWRDAAGAAEHAAIEIKDKLIASIAPQCLSKQPVAAAALKAVAAATGRSPTDAEVAADSEGAEEGAEGGAEGGADENEEDDNDEAAAAMDALAGFADAGDGPPAPTNAPLPLGKEKNPRLGDVEVKAEDSEPKGLDTPDERVHA